MSPERRTRRIEALKEIEKALYETRKFHERYAEDGDRKFEDLSDAELTTLLINVETWIDRATQTDAG